MSSNNYKDPILQAIIKVLDEHGPAILKGRYGTGDPVVVNKSQLKKPMAFISFEGHTIGEPTNSHLRITGNVVINLVNDMTQDFGQGLDAKSHMTLVGLILGIEFDGEKYSLRRDSIVGALRSHQDMGHGLRLSLGTSDNVDYDAMSRGKGIVTIEGVLNIIATVDVLNPQFVDRFMQP
jgi:hypothetical protein